MNAEDLVSGSTKYLNSLLCQVFNKDEIKLEELSDFINTKYNQKIDLSQPKELTMMNVLKPFLPTTF